eukprot:4739668-Pleurochrysis_carterae.AAC.1
MHARPVQEGGEARLPRLPRPSVQHGQRMGRGRSLRHDRAARCVRYERQPRPRSHAHVHEANARGCRHCRHAPVARGRAQNALLGRLANHPRAPLGSSLTHEPFVMVLVVIIAMVLPQPVGSDAESVAGRGLVPEEGLFGVGAFDRAVQHEELVVLRAAVHDFLEDAETRQHPEEALVDLAPVADDGFSADEHVARVATQRDVQSHAVLDGEHDKNVPVPPVHEELAQRLRSRNARLEHAVVYDDELAHRELFPIALPQKHLHIGLSMMRPAVLYVRIDALERLLLALLDIDELLELLRLPRI